MGNPIELSDTSIVQASRRDFVSYLILSLSRIFDQEGPIRVSIPLIISSPVFPKAVTV
jgi:hypothetical protein